MWWKIIQYIQNHWDIWEHHEQRSTFYTIEINAVGIRNKNGWRAVANYLRYILHSRTYFRCQTQISEHVHLQTSVQACNKIHNIILQSPANHTDLLLYVYVIMQYDIFHGNTLSHLIPWKVGTLLSYGEGSEKGKHFRNSIWILSLS